VRETKKKSAKITVAAEPADRVATATFEGTATDVKCTDCEKKVENEDRLDLSMIRYREPLCGECFSRRLQDA
jgi:DNA-directed RNA polymerase subunit RPC12/RpoP